MSSSDLSSASTLFSYHFTPCLFVSDSIIPASGLQCIAFLCCLIDIFCASDGSGRFSESPGFKARFRLSEFLQPEGQPGVLKNIRRASGKHQLHLIAPVFTVP